MSNGGLGLAFALSIMIFRPPFPLILILVLIAVVLWLTWRDGIRRVRRGDVSRAQAALLIGLRSFALALLAFILCAPHIRIGESLARKPRLLLYVDTSASFGINDCPPDRAGRLDASRQAIIEKVIPDAVRRFDIDVFGFNAAIEPSVGSETPDAALEALTVKAARTDIALPIRHLAGEVSAAASDGQSTIAAAILVSDGRRTAETAGALSDALNDFDAAVRIYTVSAGTGDGKDLALTGIRTDRTAALNTRVTVQGAVRQIGCESIVATVKLVRRSDNHLIETKELRFKSEPTGDSLVSMPFEFRFVPTLPGVQTYRLELTSLPAVDEITFDNNVHDFLIDARDRPLRVLYMEGSMYMRENDSPPSRIWEHQYLQQALEEGLLDPEAGALDVVVKILARDNSDGVAARAGVEWVRQWDDDPAKGFPATRGALYEYDVIICSDIDSQFFTRDQLEWMRDFVRNEGGGFVMIGGWTSFGPGGYDESILDALLPVDMLGLQDEFVEDEDVLKWRIPKASLSHPVMKLDDDPKTNAEIWDAMPRFHGFNRVERAKPAALVLAEHPDIDRFGDVNGMPAPIVAVQQYGRGRTMAFCTDTTAGWGRDFETNFGPSPGDNRYFRAFWRNAVRWLADDRIRRPSRTVLHLPDSSAIEAGRTMTLRVRVRDKDYQPALNARVETTAQSAIPDSEPVILSLRTSRDDEPGIYRADYTPKTPGFYRFETRAFINDELLGDDSTAVYATAPDIEYAEPTPDRGLLDEIARRTGGEPVSLETAGRLNRIIERNRLQADRHIERSVWDRTAFFIALAALLCVEWFLRKKRSLP